MTIMMDLLIMRICPRLNGNSTYQRERMSDSDGDGRANITDPFRTIQQNGRIQIVMDLETMETHTP